MGKNKRVDADNIIYHYIQNVLIADESNSSFVKELISNLIIGLSIWIDPKIYEKLPVAAPFVIRDPSCRKDKKTNQDQWGYADENGFFRDDNSIIKGIVKSLKISSVNKALYKECKPGTGYIACHIWRNLENQEILASRYYKTNSFIPNLVWIPKQIAQLTDREGSFAQQLIQTISYKLYKDSPCEKDVDDIWSELNNPKLELPDGFTIENLNIFSYDEKWLRRRTDSLIKEVKAILSHLEQGTPLTQKIKSTSYTQTLPESTQNMSRDQKNEIISWLNRFV